MTRSELIEIIARAMCRSEPDTVASVNVVSDGGAIKPLSREALVLAWERHKAEASAILAALSSAGHAVVPKGATDGMGFVGGITFEEAAFANQKHVFDAAKEVWALMVAQAELERDPAMVAAEDLAGEKG